ncbi:MAG: FAD:protein FMN transferase [Pseudomonadota bacterium]
MKARFWLNKVPEQTRNSEHGSLFLYLALPLLLLLSACAEQGGRQAVVLSGPTMGTDYRITVVSEASLDVAQLETDIVGQLDAVNASMSNWLSDSEVSQINLLPANQAFQVSNSLAEVLDEALQISKYTSGAFDITTAPAVRLWGFGSEGVVNKAPTGEQLESLRQSVGYYKLRLNGNTLIKSHPGTEVNLSAIAKGYAVDQIAQLLESQGVTDFLVNVGGELRASGRNVNQQVWKVAIEKPQVLGGVQEVIELRDLAIATSGDYRNYLLIDGKKYSHTIDPMTLRPVLHRIALVSVLSEQTSTADALATALMAMGEDAAIRFADQHEIAAYFVLRSAAGDGFEVSKSEKFKQLTE